MKNMTDVKMAKPFLCRVASRRSALESPPTVEPEKVEVVGETVWTAVEPDARTAL